jgi:ATP-dependent HslUV protease ATP-binding subunit HslU
VSFTASESGGQVIRIDAGYVNERLDKLAENEDLSRYVL